MANFASLDQVAEEELLITRHSKHSFVCAESIDRDYYKDYDVQTYGVNRGAITVAPVHEKQVTMPQDVTGHLASGHVFDASVQLLGEHSLTAAAAAVAVAEYIGLDTSAIKAGIESLRPFSGRMNVLGGVKNSVLIDDTYNASPEAVQKALITLYEMKAPQKIAVLGSMNELGAFSEESHQKIGDFCNPSQLDLVITIGDEAGRFLAPHAKAKGCKVESFASPYEAGACVKNALKDGAVVLFKGSQNGVFAEEAIKSVLANTEDSQKLVRQSSFWLKKKREQFSATVLD
jgi:UDP-N-acetylmuramoyl-tripeptide--D-alanyl-D-alanine ligase